MAGNIWRAFNRNPDLGRNLGELLGQLKQNSDRESQYAALDELLNPKDTVPVMGDPATIALRGGGTAELPRFQGTETITRPRTMLDLSGPETMRLASILKMNPVNAVDLLTKTAEANQPKRQIIHDAYSGVGEITTPRTGGSTYQNLQPGVPRSTTTKQPPAAKSVTRTLIGSDGKPHDILFMFDNLGNELGKKDLGVSYQKPAAEKPDAAAASQKRAAEAEIRKLTAENKKLTVDQRKIWEGHSPVEGGGGLLGVGGKEGGFRKMNPATGKVIEFRGQGSDDALNALHEQDKRFKDQIEQNLQRIEELNHQIGGTWRAPGEQQSAQPQVSDEDTQALDWAKRNPNDPRAAKILKLLGGK